MPGYRFIDTEAALHVQPTGIQVAVDLHHVRRHAGDIEARRIRPLGVHDAGLEAMRRAVVQLADLDYLLVDARTIPDIEIRQMAYVRADSFIYCVAAASIVAKVYRDGLMLELDGEFPGYGFARHMGYGTAAHMAALDRLGPCASHRRSFAPIRRRLGASD